LHIGNRDEGPDLFVACSEFVADGEGTVGDWLLEIDWAEFAAGVDDPRFAEVVLREAPLAAVGRGGFFDDALGRPANAPGVVGGVEPVVGAPDEAAGLVLEVGLARLAAGEEFFESATPSPSVSRYSKMSPVSVSCTRRLSRNGSSMRGRSRPSMNTE